MVVRGEGQTEVKAGWSHSLGAEPTEGREWRVLGVGTGYVEVSKYIFRDMSRGQWEIQA